MTGHSHLALPLAAVFAACAGFASGFIAGVSSAHAPVSPTVVVQLPAGLAAASCPAPAAAPAAARVMLETQEAAPGAPIRFSIDSPATLGDGAWVGLIPSAVPHGSEDVNDEHDIDYVYVGGADRTYELAAPREPGRYDLRLHDRHPGGVEIHSVEVVVTSGEDWLQLATQRVAPGERLSVHFAAPSARDDTAWIGVVPASIPHGSEEVNDRHDLSYVHLGPSRRGMLRLHAPLEPGTYDLRLHDSDDGGRELVSMTFEVTGF
jgi:hypothetical protein